MHLQKKEDIIDKNICVKKYLKFVQITTTQKKNKNDEKLIKRVSIVYWTLR